MAGSATARRVGRAVGVTALSAGFILSGSALAFAQDTVVNVPGTTITNACKVTVSQSVDPFARPPAHASESSTCTV